MDTRTTRPEPTAPDTPATTEQPVPSFTSWDPMQLPSAEPDADFDQLMHSDAIA